jgi:hypothetical protein
MNHRYILTLVVGGFFASCQHQPLSEMPKPSPFTIRINYEDTAINCSHCKPISQLDVIRVDWKQAYPYYLKFAVNPNNSNEIVYYQVAEVFKVDMWDRIFTAHYYNLKTKQKKILYTGHLDGAPQWHSNGWVLIARGGQVWKWHPDSSSMLFPADVRINCSAVWNPNGTQFGYLDRQSSFTIGDAQNGQSLNPISNPQLDMPYLVWSHPDTLTLQQQNGAVVTYHLKSNQFGLLVPNRWGWGQGFCWLNDSKTMIFSTYTGLYITDTQTKQVKKIKCACATVDYRCPVYVPKRHQIYALRVENEAPNPPTPIMTIMTHTKLVKMNIDGSEEQVIDLPQ